MDLALTPSQLELGAAARAAFEAGSPPPLVEGPLTDLVIVARELGRAAVPSTFHTEVLVRLLGGRSPSLAAVALDLTPPPGSSGDASSNRASAGADMTGPPAASTGRPGGERASAGAGDASSSPGSGAGPTAPPEAHAGQPRGDGDLTGVAEFVAHAGEAAALLVCLGDDRVAEVDLRGRGVEVTAQRTIADDGRSRVTLSGAPVARAWTCDVQAAVARAAVVLAADAVGAAEGALDAAVAHVRQRHQWGAPLGTLQAVQHRCADMLIDVTVAADAVLDAAGMADRGEPEPEVRLATAYAKATAVERCRRVTASAHQLAGGQGILADRPFHRWYRRVKAAEPTLGDLRHHRTTIAAALLDR